MKNRFPIRLMGKTAILALLFLAGSCLEYTVNTSVNRDGSIFREYTVRGDSSGIFKGSLRIPTGKQWKITTGFEDDDKQKEASDKQYFYNASRKFSNIKEFSDWLASDSASTTVKIKADLKKHFRWFYSYYEYTEMYPMTFQFKNVSVDSFLTEKEQSVLTEDGRAVYSPGEKKWIWKKDTVKFLYSHTDSLEIKTMSDDCEKKLETWMTVAIINEFSNLVKKILPDEPAFADIKNKLVRRSEFLHDKVFFSKDSNIMNNLVTLADSLASSKKLSEFYANNPMELNDFGKKIDSVDLSLFSDDYEYSLNMPGRVFSTNAFTRDGTRLKWKFEPIQFFFKDFEMKAESRVANRWIMVLTGLIAAGLVWVIFAKKK